MEAIQSTIRDEIYLSTVREHEVEFNEAGDFLACGAQGEWLEYLEENPGVGEAHKPGPWWALLCGLNLVATEVLVTVSYLQGKKIHLVEQ